MEKYTFECDVTISQNAKTGKIVLIEKDGDTTWAHVGIEEFVDSAADMLSDHIREIIGDIDGCVDNRKFKFAVTFEQAE